MKISSTWNFRAIVSKGLIGLVLAVMIGSIDVVPALAKDDHKSMGKHDNGRYENRGRGNDRGHYEYERGRRVYRPYGYGGGVYVPPPVIYAPPPPPGIGIFFPPIIIHP